MKTFTVLGRLLTDPQAFAKVVTSSTIDSAVNKVKRDFPELQIQLVISGYCLPKSAKLISKCL